MATLTQTRPTLLRNALRANAVFSGLSGLILTVGSAQFPSIMGAGTTLVYAIVGIILLFHAINLIFNTRSDDIAPAFAWYAILGDVVWVIATAVILLTDAFAFNVTGKWLLLIIGDIVLVFAIAQYIGLRRVR